MDPARAILAIPISDPGLKLHHLVWAHLFEFDESGGTQLWWQPVGPPERGGPVYLALRSPELKARDRGLTDEYERRCEHAGGEDRYLQKTYIELAQKYDIPADRRPSIVFLTDPPNGGLATLDIAPAALDDGNRQRDLACFLHQQLRGDRIAQFARAGEFTKDSLDELQKYVKEMGSRIAGPIARGNGVPKKMWESYCVAAGLVDRPDPKEFNSGQVELDDKGVLTLSVFTGDTLDGTVRFGSLNPDRAVQRNVMMTLLSRWPRGVELKELLRVAYGDECMYAASDNDELRKLEKNFAQLLRDVRDKLQRACINPDIVPDLFSKYAKRGAIAIRLAHLKGDGFGRRD